MEERLAARLARHTGLRRARLGVATLRQSHAKAGFGNAEAGAHLLRAESDARSAALRSITRAAEAAAHRGAPISIPHASSTKYRALSTMLPNSSFLSIRSW